MTLPIQRGLQWRVMHELRTEQATAQEGAGPVRYSATLNRARRNSPGHEGRVTQHMQRSPVWHTMHQLRVQQATAREGA
jgi:hypothetical protein